MSPHKYRLDLSALAKRDLRDILSYTLHKWGECQLSEYKNLLDSGLNAIAHNPTSGRTRKRSTVRVFPVGRHVIFYRLGQDVVYIIRILHDRMNDALHLNE